MKERLGGLKQLLQFGIPLLVSRIYNKIPRFGVRTLQFAGNLSSRWCHSSA
ncbi:hypothetical protein HCR18_03905 [Wolbachia pipientis]|uniref:hypothetical protein n=1 Tax=Wolbachia pipientis TaxID=955 RepID=UPI001C71379D|nr:hypothetical protein [Wolbachia pipientis]